MTSLAVLVWSLQKQNSQTRIWEPMVYLRGGSRKHSKEWRERTAQRGYMNEGNWDSISLKSIEHIQNCLPKS